MDVILKKLLIVDIFQVSKLLISSLFPTYFALYYLFKLNLMLLFMKTRKTFVRLCEFLLIIVHWKYASEIKYI